MDKYRPAEPQVKTNWFVEKANSEVRIEDVLNDHFTMDTPVPYDARSWKTSCPFRDEHLDGGLDKQFRVYSDTNTCHCFESHGTFDPVRLWMQGPGVGQRFVEAAISLLEAYGIDTHTKTYQERFEASVEASRAPQTLDPVPVVAGLNVYLGVIPEYVSRQYDEDVVELLAEAISQINSHCETDSLDEFLPFYSRLKSDLVDKIVKKG